MKLLKMMMTFVLALVFTILPILTLPQAAQAQLANQKNIQTLFVSASRGTTTSSAIDIASANAFVSFLSVTAQSGTNPTLDVVIQDSLDNSVWFTLITHTQVTASTGTEVIAASRSPGRYIRAIATVGGTSTPLFTFSLKFQAFNATGVAVSTTQGGALAGTQSTFSTTNGSTAAIKSISEEVTLSTGGATTDSSANLLPANSLILGVTGIVTTAIAGVDATAVQLGDSAVAARFGSGATLTLGGTITGITMWNGNISATNAGPTQASAAVLRITLSGGSDQTPSAGKVRVTVWYIQFTAPTS